MIRRPPRSTLSSSSAASDVYKRQICAWYMFDTGPLRESFGGRYKGDDCNLEKLLFFYPEDCDDNQKKDRVGCCEALVNFTKVFSPDKPCSAVHLEKQRHAYLECAPGVWCVLEVNNPVDAGAEGEAMYQEEELDDLWLQSLLKQSYDFFRLFHGNLSQCWERMGEDGLRSALANFMPRCIGILADQISQYNVLNSLDGITYLPVDKQVFLSIQYVVNIIESSFEEVKPCAFIYDDQLVWSGFEQDMIRNLYHMCLHGGPSIDSSRHKSAQKGVDAASSLRTWSGCQEHPTMYDDDGNECILFLCGIGQVLAMFQLPRAQATDALLLSLNEYVMTEVGNLAKIMAKNYGPAAGSDEPWKYIYFNQMNLALKTSLAQKAGAVTPAVMRTLNEMLAHFER
eukprot:TRINITY_DN12807_c0_g1_i10.p1 TRINITY_DN12807_c0_g1~~TRINITY_DN12807_c0_g1_i10.p1  ORF type:complete len:398 (+),score=91.62 TRINITY_DN12807_c0_g1_i10:100-1293(+)